MFVIFVRTRHQGSFLRGTGNDIRDYGGTNLIDEAATFKTKKSAERFATEYVTRCHADGFAVLKKTA